ncbi:MAG: MMPL family transporter [Hyphomicrobiaceae bacterium]
MDDRVRNEPTPAPEGPSVGLGLERIGLVALAYPILLVLIVAGLTVVAWMGINRLKVDDSLTELFRNDTVEFRSYEQLATRFPSSEYDVLVVVEGRDLLKRPQLMALRNLVTDLHFVDSLDGLISLFSARGVPEAGQLPPPLFPEVLPEGQAYDDLIAHVRDNEIIRDKLLSPDGELALVVIALDRATVEGVSLREAVGQIRAQVDESLAGTGLTAELSGAPVMQLEIRNAVERDQLTYNGLGLAIGAIIAGIFFRRLSLLLLTVLPPVLAIIWSLGVLGWLDFRLNLFLNVMTPLIMVMGFSDSMQIVFALRDRLIAGDDKVTALRFAILVVGPACVLTDGAACLSFVTLAFSDSALIRTFGYAGALATILSYLAVIVLLPLLGMFLIRNTKGLEQSAKLGDGAMQILRDLSAAIIDRVLARPGIYALGGIALLGLFTAAHLSLEPRYRLADQVPDREQALEAGSRLDEKLTGANPVHILVELPKGTELFNETSLGVLKAVHEVVEKQPGIGNVWSVETLRRWLAEKAGETSVEVLKKYVDILPEHLVRRFISVEQDAVVVTGRLPDVDSAQILPVVEAMDRAMEPIRQAHPGYKISVTGLPAIAARNSASMIEQLNASLTVEMVFVAALIGLAFRSFFIGAVSMLPGLFPIVASGTLLWLTNEGLQFASIVALTVAFGLGLDATIHFLNRLRLEDRPDEDPALGVHRAAILIGPALMLTTIVLAFGLAVTVFSELPSLRVFGRLCAVTLMAALIGDLVILPATMLIVRRWIRAFKARRAKA